MIVDRVTIDIDHYESSARLRALRAHYGLQQHDAVADVNVYLSSGGKGLHIEGLLSERLTDETRLSLRRSLCDDAKRAALDEERGAAGHATNICWHTKAGNDGEREQVRDIWAAFDRIERSRASGYQRIRAVAQNGRKAVWDVHGIDRASKVRGLEG